jgi:formylglycine-generating enzyme required for sulfatase activity
MRQLSSVSKMVLLQGRGFEMGTPGDALDRLQQRYQINFRDLFTPEVPRHFVSLDPFYFDRYPVTNAQFKVFVDAQPRWSPDNIPAHLHNGAYLDHWDGDTYPKQLADHPVVYVCWYAAVAYAQWSGKRLPTEAEWEFAARGGSEEAEYPWGDAPADPSRANYAASGLGTTTPVGNYPPNPFGLYDLAGNVWEYCLDEWRAEYYASSPGHNPVAGGNRFYDDSFYAVTERRVVRGGSWGGAPVNLRVTYRDSHPPTGAGPHVGFRCARSA